MRYCLHALQGWLFILLIGGCSLTQPNPAPVIEPGMAKGTPGEQKLQVGMKQYERGEFKRAASTLQQAIDNGLTPKSRIIAHKHLAFIYCISNRLNQCRSEFGKTFDLDPRFDLAPAEAGHPQWGPVFRNVKARRQLAS